MAYLTKNLISFIARATLVAVVFSTVAGLAPVAQAATLQILSVETYPTDTTVTVIWSTNEKTTGVIEYGKVSDEYTSSLATNLSDTTHAMTLRGLERDTRYYLRVTARTSTTEVRSFERTFVTKKEVDTTAPVISGVGVEFITPTTATIQWLTDEPASTEVEFGLSTSYNRKAGNGSKTLLHDITLTGLISGAQYHFRVKSKDDHNNVAIWEDLVFRTALGENQEDLPLTITAVTPTSENDPLITDSSVVISWQTSRLADGSVTYGTKPTGGKTVKSGALRATTHTITLVNLSPGTKYYFKVNSKDVLNKTASSTTYSFTTKGITTGGSAVGGSDTTDGVDNNNYINTTGRVLGSATCSVDFARDKGFYGIYYNLSEDHPDVELYKGSSIAWTKVATQNDWYNDEYYAFDRIDQGLEFGGRFFPVNEGKKGDPFHFAVNWRAIMEAPADGSYTMNLKSDDDAWVFVDGKLILNNGGVHSASAKGFEVTLEKGLHTFEIFYAERSQPSAFFTFTASTSLKFYPLPAGCSLDDVLNGRNPSGGNGQVLGSNNDDDANGQGSGAGNQTPIPYACNPNLGYTKMVSLYKTKNSPDVWAILETGQKHYITSPAAFNKYQCDWNKVRVVSQATLDRYANATLVRTPQTPTVYHLFDRPNHKWLKRTIPSPTVFVSYPKNYWGNIARIDQLDIDAYPTATLISAANSNAVYLVDGKFKRLIPNETVFEAHGYDWIEVVELSPEHVASFEDGAVVQ